MSEVLAQLEKKGGGSGSAFVNEGEYFLAQGYALDGCQFGTFTKGVPFTISAYYVLNILINVKGCSTYSQVRNNGTWHAVVGIKEDGTVTQIITNQNTVTNVNISDYDYLFTHSPVGTSTESYTITIS